jgi:hypothetical protein
VIETLLRGRPGGSANRRYKELTRAWKRRVETDEPIKSGTAPCWQDALIDCVKDLVPPNAED